MQCGRVLISISFLLVLVSPPIYSGSLSIETALEIRTYFEDRSDEGESLRGFLIHSDRSVLRRLYEKREFKPYWVGDMGIEPVGIEFLEILRDAPLDGLCPEDYQHARIESLALLEGDYRREGILHDPEHMAGFDLLMTETFLEYVSDLSGGRVDPLGVRVKWYVNGRDIDPEDLLEDVVNGERLPDIIARIGPSDPAYIRLKGALSSYRTIAAEGGWPSIPEGKVLHQGDIDGRIPLIRKRLKITGDIPNGSDGRETFNYDSGVVEGLKRFQKRHGLSPDGVLGAMTIEALNVPVERRIRQIELNMERWRWLPRSLGNRYLLVNIADFGLELVEKGQAVLSMPVIVGKSYRKTPVFSSRMTYLEFSPYWTVPPTILREDKLPIIKKKPQWIERNRYEIIDKEGDKIDPSSVDWQKIKAETFPGVLRQKPGPLNALGGVKFMFPNPFSVYLHDTPDRYLFRREVRSFSSGCIRIERPLDLAQYLLEDDPDWDCDRILDHYNGSAPEVVRLKRPLTVYVLYWTAWVDAEEHLHFRNDLYLRDEDLDRALMRERVGSEEVLEPPESDEGSDAGPE